MTGLTVDQWEALRRSRERCRDVTPTVVLGNTLGLPVAWASFLATVVEHVDVLIDAARPKCPTCDGDGVVYLGDYCPDCGRVDGVDCPDCTDHPRWAA